MTSDKPIADDPLSESQLRRRLDRLSRLLDVTRAVAAAVDVDEILKTIVNEACKALDGDRASLYRYDPKLDQLYTSVVTELEVDEIRRDLDSGVTGYVARHRAMANIPDPLQDARWNADVDRLTGYQTRNILAAPLVSPHDSSLLGVLQLLNKTQGSFDKLDEELLEAFSQHAAVALDRARLVRQLQQRKEVETSLNVARHIQRGFMPSRLPDIPGYEVATWWLPNQAVGGDYCDVLAMRDGRTGLCIADVSGHGLGPSLLMASVRAALRALILEHSSPGVLLEMLGISLADDLRHGRFITMVLAILDHEAHVIEFANAGHAPAMHFSAASGRFVALEATGLPLGVLDRTEYPCGPPITIEVGDLIVLCTDGIVEAINGQDEQFGLARLEDLIRGSSREPVQSIVQGVGSDVEAHYGGDSPPDDLTILAMRRNA